MSRKKKIVRSRTKEERKGTNYWLWGGLAGLAVVGLIALLVVSLQPQAEVTIEGLQTFRNQARDHNDAVSYNDPLPPTGGVHAPIWQNCGIYDTPIAGKNAVHSLEHGAVWVTYQPDLPADQIGALQDTVRGQSFILLSPWPDQAEPIVLTAWGLQLSVENVSDQRLEQFIDEYRLGPQTPEPGATCSGGVGEPIS